MIRCVSCGQEYDDDEVIYTCEKCGSVLELVNEIDEIGRASCRERV